MGIPLQKIKAYFDPYIKSSMKDWVHIQKYLSLDHHRSREVIKNAGDRERKIRFILEGGAVMLVRDKTRDICLDICLENEFITDLDALTNGNESDIIIKTFEKMKVVAMKRDDLLRLYKTSAFCSGLGRIVVERRLHKLDIRNLRYRGSIRQRYESLLQHEPHLLLRAPQKYVASYIGVSPQGLSRFKSNI